MCSCWKWLDFQKVQLSRFKIQKYVFEFVFTKKRLYANCMGTCPSLHALKIKGCKPRNMWRSIPRVCLVVCSQPRNQYLLRKEFVRLIKCLCYVNYQISLFVIICTKLIGFLDFSTHYENIFPINYRK